MKVLPQVLKLSYFNFRYKITLMGNYNVSKFSPDFLVHSANS